MGESLVTTYAVLSVRSLWKRAHPHILNAEIAEEDSPGKAP